MKTKQSISYWAALLFAAILLGGCGGGDSSPAAEVFPRDIQYKNLDGKANGLIDGGIGIYLSAFSPNGSSLAVNSNCGPGKRGDLCFSLLTPLASLEQFQAFVSQSPGEDKNKPDVLVAGSAIDFSREQLWAFKLVMYNPAEAVMRIQETAETIEVQPIVCNMSILDGNVGPVIKDLFIVVSRDLPSKPVVLLDRSDVFYGQKCPFAELVRK